MSEDVFSPGTIMRRMAERDAEIRRLRAREIVLMRQLRSRQDEIDALRRKVAEQSSGIV